MNKTAIRALLAASFLTAGAAQAASSVQIPLTGVLPKACDVSAFLNGPFDALDMTSTSVQGSESITARCNYGGTLSVTLSSLNAGKMVNRSHGGAEVPYGVTISGSPLNNASLASPQTISNWPAVTNAVQTRSISVTLANAATVAGTYTDTITVSVAPN